MITSHHSALARFSDGTADPLLRRALDSHSWYPAAQRCACGLNLRSAQHWTDHITALAAKHGNPDR